MTNKETGYNIGNMVKIAYFDHFKSIDTKDVECTNIVYGLLDRETDNYLFVIYNEENINDDKEKDGEFLAILKNVIIEIKYYRRHDGTMKDLL